MYCRNRPNVTSNDLKCAYDAPPDPLIVSGFAPKALAPRPLPRLKPDPPSFLGTNLTLAPTYLIDLCRPVLGSRSSRSLLSSERGLLPVPFARTTIMLAALALLWPRRYGIASLLRSASYQGHFQTHSIIIKNCSF